MSGNTCDNAMKSKLGGGVVGSTGNGGPCGNGGGRSRGAGSPLDRFRLRSGFGQYKFLEQANILPPGGACNRKTVLTRAWRAYSVHTSSSIVTCGEDNQKVRVPSNEIINFPGIDSVSVTNAWLFVESHRGSNLLF